MTARRFWWLWLMLVTGLCLLAIGIARAAEREGVRYEITLFFPGNAYDQVGRTHLVLGKDGEPFEYESRETCRIAITRVRVEIKGARLVCTPVQVERVR